jgi:hypothetical protein
MSDQIFDEGNQQKLRQTVERYIDRAIDELKGRAADHMRAFRDVVQDMAVRSIRFNINEFETALRQAVLGELKGDRLERLVMLHALVARGEKPEEAANMVAAVENAKGYSSNEVRT